ncbi:MAG: hypothetical protein EKK57_07280 [Proteobacteria bacterium]|nr:MAG: hypothetical protein EKK57_07280 [Pseudomonadota bacterium]
MKKISHTELIELVKNSPGAFPVGILSETDARAKKTGNPYGEIRKRVYCVGFVGANYEASVNREAGRQGGDGTGSFVAKPRQWGEWLPGLESKVATHKGRLYLRTQSTPGQREKQKAEVLFYRGQNGQFLRHRDVAPFLPAKSVSSRQLTVGVGSDAQAEQIDVREYAFDNILRIRHKGETFEVVPG